MPVIGLIKEGKVPNDNRVALTPKQCRYILDQFPSWDIIAESSPNRCFKDREYQKEGIKVVEDISSATILFGIKEVPIDQLIPNKKYLFFSHTKKALTLQCFLLFGRHEWTRTTDPHHVKVVL